MPDAFSLALVVGATFLLAGFVKGVIGLGLPTVAIAVLSLIMPPAQAAAVLVVPSLVTNVWQAVVGGRLAAICRRLWSMMAGIFAGTWLGAGSLATEQSGHATTALGVVLVLYAATGLARMEIRVPRRAEPALSPLMGVATGLVTAATGVLVIPAAPYLQCLGMQRDELVQAFGLSFSVSTLALGIMLATDGVLAGTLGGISALALLPAILGMVAGQWLRGRVSPTVFRRCLFAGLLVLGAHLALRAVL